MYYFEMISGVSPRPHSSSKNNKNVNKSANTHGKIYWKSEIHSYGHHQAF